MVGGEVETPGIHPARTREGKGDVKGPAEDTGKDKSKGKATRGKAGSVKTKSSNPEGARGGGASSPTITGVTRQRASPSTSPVPDDDRELAAIEGEERQPRRSALKKSRPTSHLRLKSPMAEVGRTHVCLIRS